MVIRRLWASAMRIVSAHRGVSSLFRSSPNVHLWRLILLSMRLLFVEWLAWVGPAGSILIRLWICPTLLRLQWRSSARSLSTLLLCLCGLLYCLGTGLCHSCSKRKRATACLLFACRNGLVLAVNDSELVPVCFCPGRNGNANHCMAALAAGGGSIGVTFSPTCHPLYIALRWISVSLLTLTGWAGFIPPCSVCSGAPPPGV